MSLCRWLKTISVSFEAFLSFVQALVAFYYVKCLYIIESQNAAKQLRLYVTVKKNKTEIFAVTSLISYYHITKIFVI